MALLEKMSTIHASPIAARPEKKKFTPSVKEVPMLEDYSKDPGEDFWKVFPVHRNLRSGTPFKLSVTRLREFAMRARLSCPDMEILEKVIGDITHGADLKVNAGYIPTKGKNAPSAIRDGPWVTDAVAKGVLDGIYAGPFRTCPKMATVNSMQTAPKPNGKVRIIMNQSAPKGRGVNQSISTLSRWKT